MTAQAILDYAKKRGRPIAAILNSHWHLDHTTGNLDLRQIYPRADVYATTAIEGALDSYLNRDRSGTDKLLADPQDPPNRLRRRRCAAATGSTTPTHFGLPSRFSSRRG